VRWFFPPGRAQAGGPTGWRRLQFPRFEPGHRRGLEGGEDCFARYAPGQRDLAQKGVERAEAQRLVVRNRNAVVSGCLGLQNDVTADTIHLTVRLSSTENSRPNCGLTGHAVVSRQHFVSHQMQPQNLWGGLIEIERCHRLTHMGAQLLPAVRLGDDTFSERLGDEAAVGLLSDGKDQFVHGCKVGRVAAIGKPCPTTQ
jgi:hypothetical protein